MQNNSVDGKLIVITDVSSDAIKTKKLQALSLTSKA